MNSNANIPISYASIWRIAYPMLVSVLMQQLIGIVDTAFLGRVGEIELGGAGLGSIFYVCIFVIGMAFGQGAQILMARRNGEGRYREMGAIFYHSLVFLMLLGATLFVGIQVCRSTILPYAISNAAVAAATDTYLSWRIYGMFAAYVAISMRAFFLATTYTHMLTANALVMVVSNIVLDYLLIFGHCGFPCLGLAGAAIASVLSEVCSMLYFVIYARWRFDFRRYALGIWPKFQRAVFGRILKLSTWTMLQDFISLATWFLFFLAVERLGSRELAASNILRNASSIPFMTISALASTGMTLLSNLLGMGRADDVMRMLRRVVILCYAIVLPICLLMALFPQISIGIFTNDDSLIVATTPALLVLMSCYVMTIPAQILLRGIAGTGHTRMAMLVEFTIMPAYTAFVYYYVMHCHCSLAVAWMSEYVYNGVALLLCLAFFRFCDWRHKTI